MAQRNYAAGLLFWLMAASGGAALAACLILPPWLEYQALRAERAERERQVAQLEAHILTLQKQQEHLKFDPAYVERLAQQEFGIEPAGAETIMLDPPPGDGSPVATGAGGQVPQVDDEVLPEMSILIERGLLRYPFARVFVDDRTRPLVMALGAVVLLAAIVLVRRPTARKDAA
ncbi:MAG: septum formation initiator family protein [Planctomycetes bacterium]|nr:septum formation initiator family protein [Planctomycetota bacterium]